MHRNNLAQHHAEFDADTSAKYEDIRMKATKEWLKPASVSLARLDEVKAKVYNIGLGDAAHIKAQGSLRQRTGSEVPMTSIATQKSAWGSNASIPDLIRQYSQRARPESAQIQVKSKPPNSRNPRPQSANELTANQVGKIRLSIAVKGAHQNLQSRPPKVPVLPPGCVPDDSSSRRYASCYDMTSGHVTSGRRPHLSVTRNDLIQVQAREPVTLPSYRQPPGSPISDAGSGLDFTSIINETADEPPPQRPDLFAMPEFIRQSNSQYNHMGTGGDSEDDSGDCLVPDDDEECGDDELIEQLTAPTRTRRRPVSAKVMSRRPLPNKPRSQSAKTSPPGPIHLQLPSADMNPDEEPEMDTERLLRTLDSASRDHSIGFTTKPGFNFIQADVRIEPPGKPEPEAELDLDLCDVIKKTSAVTFDLDDVMTSRSATKPTVKYSGNRKLRNVKSRIDSGVQLSSSARSVVSQRKTDDNRIERPKSATVSMVTVAYNDEENYEKKPSKINEVSTLISEEDLIPVTSETKTVSTNVNKNHFATIEKKENKTFTTKLLSLDGCDVMSKTSIPNTTGEVRKPRHDYTVEDSHKPPRRHYRPNLQKRTVAKQPEPVVDEAEVPDLTEVEPEVESIRPEVVEPEVEEQEKVETEPETKVEEKAVKPKPKNRPSLIRTTKPSPEKVEVRRTCASRPRSAPGKKKAEVEEQEPIYIWTRSATNVEVDTPGTRECKNMHFKLLEHGLDISVETLQRALLPPQDSSTYVDPNRSKNKMAPLPNPSDGLLSSPAVWLAVEYKKLRLAEKALERANERLFLQKRAEEKAARLLKQKTEGELSTTENVDEKKKKTVKKKRIKSASSVRTG